MLIRNFSQRLKRLEETPQRSSDPASDFRHVSPKQFPADGKLYLWPQRRESPTSLGNTTLYLDQLYYVMGYGQNVEMKLPSFVMSDIIKVTRINHNLYLYSYDLYDQHFWFYFGKAFFVIRHSFEIKPVVTYFSV